jgi:hypothetical protein
VHPGTAAARNGGMIASAIRLAAIIPLLAGGAGVVWGPAFLGEAAGPATASHLRYLSGLLLGVGLLALYCAADLSRRRDLFAVLCAMVTLGGLARALGLALDGLPPWPHLAALGMELGVVPALWWASRRQAAGIPRPMPAP